jgi:integrase
VTNRGGRPPNPKPRWENGRWELRVTMPRPAGWPADKEAPRRLAVLKGILEHEIERAGRVAKIVAAKLRAGEEIPEDIGETVRDWCGRWIEERERRGIATFAHDKGRLARHVLPILGGYSIATLGRDEIERVVEDLDRKIMLDVEDDEHLEWKTASNVWVLVTKMFDDAVNSKRKDLRARKDNPCKGIKGPERGSPKAKQYLYPSEFLKLVSHEGVPLPFRTLYAAAVFTYMRAGELEALTWDDVDLEHGVIHVTKSVNRKTSEVTSTKSGEGRRIPIEPNLYPMLKRLESEKGEQASVFWLPDDEDRAIMLRQHLDRANVKRAELFTSDATRKHITFHDLRATGITWCAVRGDDPLRIKQRCGHKGFATTEIYIREAENLAEGFGEPFPELPRDLTGGFGGFGSVSAFRRQGSLDSSRDSWSKGGSNP